MNRVPTEHQINGLCEVVDLLFVWLRDRSIPCEHETTAFRDTRTFVVFPSRDTAAAQEKSCTVIHPAENAAIPAVVELRRAIFLVASAAIHRANGAAIAVDTFEGWERLLLVHAEHVGRECGVENAGHLARVALARVRKAGTKPAKFPEPEFAHQLARGMVVAHCRRVGKVSPQTLCQIVTATGTNLTPPRLARLEAGHAWKDAPWEKIATALGRSPGEIQARARAAHNFAQEFARRLGVTDTERWFAEMVAVDGEEAARSCLLVGVAAALRLRL